MQQSIATLLLILSLGFQTQAYAQDINRKPIPSETSEHGEKFQSHMRQWKKQHPTSTPEEIAKEQERFQKERKEYLETTKAFNQQTEGPLKE